MGVLIGLVLVAMVVLVLVGRAAGRGNVTW